MIYNWLAVYFLSMLGMFIFPIYAAIDTWLWPVLFASGGLICFLTGCLKTKTELVMQSRGTAWLFILPLVLAIAAFRFPYSLSFWILLAGFVVAVCLPQGKIMKSVFTALVFTGLVFCLQTACLFPYFKIAARVHALSVLDPLLYQLFKLFGLICSYSENTIFVQTPRSLLPLVTSFEKLGLFPVAVFLVGACVTGLFRNKRNRAGTFVKDMLIVISVLFLYTLIRYVALSLVYIDFGSEKIFFKPIIVALSFLPLPFVMAACIGRKTLNDCRMKIPALARSGCKVVCAAAVGCFALAALMWFHDPGKLNQGRVLIDEYYSNWEWTDRKLDTDWYGIQSVYNYYCFGDYLQHYYTVDTLKEKLTENKLCDYDVLIIKTPTNSFTEKEINTVVRFVEKGGGVFLIGDHTNVFGTTININPLAERFGIRFNYDSTYNLLNNDLHPHEHNTLLRHPAVQDMPYFLFATSCSMNAPLMAEDILVASNLKAIRLDYSRGGYFPDKKTEKNYTFGLFLQTVGVKHGKGRVLAFPDSTCFSNFYMYIPGKPEYALGAVNWLNRQNTWQKHVAVASLAAALLCAGYLLIIAGGLSRAAFSAYVFYGGVAGLAVGALLFAAASRHSYALPQEKTPFKTVGFETEHCRFKIPDRKLLHNPPMDFHTFYVWVQRLGYRPDLFNLTEKNLLRHDVLVFVNPVKHFSEKEIDRVEKFVARGGKILVLDTPYGNQSTAYQILDRFNITIDYKQRIKDAQIYTDGKKAGTLDLCAAVKGGIPVLFNDKKRAVITYAKNGKGLVAAGCFSPMFSNKHMGETETVPDEKQQFLYKLQFWMFTCLMENRFVPFEPD